MTRAATAAIAAILATSGCGAPPPRNVLLVTLDTVRADHLGAYGGPHQLTPNLDRLAAEGVVFDQASAATPLTLPSHATMLTGLLPYRHGVHVNGGGRLGESVPTIATRLQARGFHSAAFVAASVLDHRFGLARGFEVYDDQIAKSTHSGASDAERAGDVVVDRALAWLAAPRTGPFFLWVHLYDAHAPYDPPEPFRQRWPDRPYAAEIGFVDSQVGRLLSGLPTQTVVAVVADHGEGLGEHGESTHGLLLYQSTLRVPWLLRAQGLESRRVEDPVSLADLGPTLLGLAGVAWDDAPGEAPDGRDLSEPLRTARPMPEAALLAETRYPETLGWAALRAVRRGHWKYLVASGASSDEVGAELFDLAEDAGEVKNLAPEERRRGAELRALLAPLARSAAASESSPSAMDAETRASLASLGYLAPTVMPPATGADPRQRAPRFERFQRATWARKAGDLAAAVAGLEPLVAEEPHNPVFLAELSLLLREQGEVQRGADLAARVVEIAPRDSQAWYNLGMALLRLGDAPGSERALRTALHLDERDPATLNALGVLAVERGDPRQGEIEFAAAVAADPANAVFLSNRGNALRALGRAGEAELAYRQALSMDPSHLDAANGLGALLVEADRPVEALAFFEEVLRSRPNAPEVLINRALALELIGRPEEALAAYQQILSLASRNPELATQRRVAEGRIAALGGQR